MTTVKVPFTISFIHCPNCGFGKHPIIGYYERYFTFLETEFGLWGVCPNCKGQFQMFEYEERKKGGKPR